jgi:hypothetical protein
VPDSARLIRPATSNHARTRLMERTRAPVDRIGPAQIREIWRHSWPGRGCRTRIAR